MNNKGRRLPPEVLTKEEVLALMDACSKRAPTGKRDRALICLLWRGQLRISEALKLKPADVDLETGLVRVLVGKGGKSRTVGVDPKCCSVLGIWLEARSKLGMNGHQALFCTLKGGRMDSTQIREKLPRLGAKAGITKRVHAHGLRHTGASELVEEGASLLEIQEQLGHSSAATTDRYLKQINPKARLERMRGREW
jgi:integrase/recombinase XerD